jgi:hypothetical protein
MRRWASTDGIAVVTTRIYGWLSSRQRLVMTSLVLAGGVAYLAFQIWSIYSAIPALPTGRLQIVGLTSDGARYVAMDDHMERNGKLRARVLVVFEQLLKTNGVSIRFEAKQEWIDCSKSEIELEGAGFYNDQGQQVLSRYLERTPEAAKPIDMEMGYLCRNKRSLVPPVTDYQAVLQQERAVRAGAIGKSKVVIKT